MTAEQLEDLLALIEQRARQAEDSVRGFGRTLGDVNAIDCILSRLRESVQPVPASPANKLPDGWVKDGLALARGAHVFGVPFEEMSRDDLIAAAAHGWNEQRNLVKAHQRDRDLMLRTRR